MADDYIVTVQPEDVFASVAVHEDLSTVSTTLQNPISMADLYDVDLSNLENGSVLVYKSLVNKWTSTRLLDLQVMEGGEF